MLDFLESFFAPSSFIPQVNCNFWKLDLVLLHVASDSLIALAYYSITIALFYFVQKRQDLPFYWIFLLFGALSVSGGNTHIMEILTLWYPIYWLSGFVKAFTAIISIYTAVLMLPLIPKALALPSPAEIEAANCKLEAEIFVRKHMEERLRSSQQMLQLVMDNIPQTVFWKDKNLVYLGCNHSFARMAGLANPEDIVGLTDYDLPWKPEETEFFRECDRRLMQTNTPEYHIIETIQQANGKQSWLDTHKIPLHDAEGNVVGILGMFEDITERQQAESALQQAKEELENRVEKRTAQLTYAIEQLQSEIAYRVEAEAALRQSQERLQEIATREALLNRLANQIRSSLDLNIILETAVQEIRDLLQIDRCIFVWYRPDSSAFSSEVGVVGDRGGFWEFVQEARNLAFPSLIGYKVPVTAVSLLTERAFDKQITRVDNARDLTDPLERRFFFSVGYTALLALPIHTQSGEIGVVSCAHVSCYRPWRDSEVELLQAVADQIAIAIDQAALYKQSRTAAAVAQAQAQQLEQTVRELKHAQAQLVQSEKMSSLGQLVAGVAHEINNPVNFIYGNISHVNQYTSDLLSVVRLYEKYYPHPAPEIESELEAIDIDFVKEDLPKILSSLKIGADRIRQIVLTLRNFSRLDEADMKAVDIHEGIDSTLLLLQNRLGSQVGVKEKGQIVYPAIQVIKQYAKLPLLVCYAGQLNQVFMNIILNAIDALQEGSSCALVGREKSALRPSQTKQPTIWITTEVSNSNQVIIRIGDNGPGMTEEVRQRVFDPFFTTKPVGSGTGLGMSIGYQIVVEKHGGQLTCISAPGQGTEFVIQIPIQK